MQSTPLMTRWQRRYNLHVGRVMRSLGFLGMAITIPTAMGMAAGVWIDTLWPGSHSWFSILAPVGFGFGCISALFWGFLGQNDI